MASTPQSRKAKGRHLQKVTCAALLEIGKAYGLVADDITSRSMGANGVDVILSPAAKKVFGELAIECKNVEALNVPAAFKLHASKYKTARCVLVHKRNHDEPLVTLRLTDLLALVEKELKLNASATLIL